MIVGVIAGPYCLGLIQQSQVANLGYVTMFALSFIAFSAGSELYLPELQSLFKRILILTGVCAAFSYVLSCLFIYGIGQGGLVPFLQGQTGSCQFTVSMIAASIMVARSPGTLFSSFIYLKYFPRSLAHSSIHPSNPPCIHACINPSLSFTLLSFSYSSLATSLFNTLQPLPSPSSASSRPRATCARPCSE
jgi:hypothetical protein